MKKIIIFAVLVSALILCSCGGGGGGGGSNPASTQSGPQVLARFVSSMNANFVMNFNSGSQAVCTTSVYNVTLDVDYFTWSFQSGNFTNGVLNFSGPQNPTITITNSAFNYHDDGGSSTLIPFTKTSDSGSTAVFSGVWVSGSSLILDFKSNNTYTMSGTGVFAGTTASGTYALSSGDFNNGTGVVDGDTITVTNGQYTLVVPVQDVNGTNTNLTMTFVKQ